MHKTKIYWNNYLTYAKSPLLNQLINRVDIIILFIMINLSVNVSENILEFITRLTIDFQDNLKTIPNSSINTLLNYDIDSSLLQRRPKFIPELLNYNPFLRHRSGQTINLNSPDATPR